MRASRRQRLFFDPLSLPSSSLTCRGSASGHLCGYFDVYTAFMGRRGYFRGTPFLLLLLVGCLPGLPGIAAAEQLKFIFLPLMGGNSPSMDLMGVAAALQARGHSVLAVVTEDGLGFAKQAAARHSSNTTAESITYLSFKMASDSRREKIGVVIKQGQHPGKFSSLMMLAGIQGMLAEPCAALMQDSEAMQRLKAFGADAIMGIALPMPFHDSCGCALSHVLGVPFIDVNGHPMIDAPPMVPQFGAGVTEADLKTVRGFLRNLAAFVIRNVVPTLAVDLGSDPWVRLRQAVGLPRAASSCLLTNAVARMRGQSVGHCSTLLEVLLGSFLLEPPRPLAAHKKLVGPGTPRPAHPIQPQSVADFVEEAAPHGVVLAAFGSTIQSMVLTHTDLQELAKGFASLAPTRVLWAMSDKGLPDGVQLGDLPLGSNTRVVSWVDYNDVLGHPNTRVFVSHCGVHSVYEAAFHGVPVVAVPFQFEQAAHADRLVARGVGVVSREAPAFRKADTDPMHYTAQGISGLIREVMSNASYSAAARGMSVALQAYAAHRQPYQRAADEIELAIYSASSTTSSSSSFSRATGSTQQVQQEL